MSSSLNSTEADPTRGLLQRPFLPLFPVLQFAGSSPGGGSGSCWGALGRDAKGGAARTEPEPSAALAHSPVGTAVPGPPGEAAPGDVPPAPGKDRAPSCSLC